MDGMPDGMDPTVVAGLMQFQESMMPFIEWAEGQKAMMQKRGWSLDSADAYARELLIGMQRSMFNTMLKQS